MERLIVIYKDDSKLIVTDKRKGVVMGYYDRNIRDMPSVRSAVKSAVIQRYPKKDNPPIVLVGDENPADSRKDQVLKIHYRGSIYRSNEGIDALVDPWFDAESVLPFPIPQDAETSDVFFYALYNPDNDSMKYFCHVEFDDDDEPERLHEFTLSETDVALLKYGMEAMCQKECNCSLLDLWHSDSSDK